MQKSPNHPSRATWGLGNTTKGPGNGSVRVWFRDDACSFSMKCCGARRARQHPPQTKTPHVRIMDTHSNAIKLSKNPRPHHGPSPHASRLSRVVRPRTTYFQLRVNTYAWASPKNPTKRYLWGSGFRPNAKTLRLILAAGELSTSSGSSSCWKCLPQGFGIYDSRSSFVRAAFCLEA